MITVYYDGKCGMCSKEIRHYKQLARPDIFIWHDVATDPSLIEPLGVPLVDALRRLHARDAEGNWHIGVAAFILIWRHLGRLKWSSMAWFLKLPLMFQIATFAYNKLSDHRFANLAHCQMALK
jgi:predicted DCC family thiol-disulfide oxidoreductase YuxK